MSTKYVVLVGLNYGQTFKNPGDIADDIPAKSIPWLMEDGCISIHNAEVE